MDYNNPQRRIYVTESCNRRSVTFSFDEEPNHQRRATSTGRGASTSNSTRGEAHREHAPKNQHGPSSTAEPSSRANSNNSNGTIRGEQGHNNEQARGMHRGMNLYNDSDDSPSYDSHQGSRPADTDALRQVMKPGDIHGFGSSRLLLDPSGPVGATSFQFPPNYGTSPFRQTFDAPVPLSMPTYVPPAFQGSQGGFQVAGSCNPNTSHLPNDQQQSPYSPGITFQRFQANFSQSQHYLNRLGQPRNSTMENLRRLIDDQSPSGDNEASIAIYNAVGTFANDFAEAVLAISKGFGKGVANELVDQARAIVYMAANPRAFVSALTNLGTELGHIVSNPRHALDLAWQASLDWYEEFNVANPEHRAEMLGRLTVVLLQSIQGVAGLGAGARAATGKLRTFLTAYELERSVGNATFNAMREALRESAAARAWRPVPEIRSLHPSAQRPVPEIRSLNPSAQRPVPHNPSRPTGARGRTLEDVQALLEQHNLHIDISPTASNVDKVILETLLAEGSIESAFTLTTDEALNAGLTWVGEGYWERPTGNGVFASRDGFRQFRIDDGSITGSHWPYYDHVHLEEIIPDRLGQLNTFRSKNHIRFID